MSDIDRTIWNQIPGTEEHVKWTDSVGSLALFVSPAGQLGPRGKYRPGFDFRWSIWRNGALLGEGFTDSLSSAKSAADQESGNVESRIRDAIRNMDIRNHRGLPEDKDFDK